MSNGAHRMEKPRTLEVPRQFSHGEVSDEEWEIQSATWLVQHTRKPRGLVDLRDTELLRRILGCQVKFTKLCLRTV